MRLKKYKFKLSSNITKIHLNKVTLNTYSIINVDIHIMIKFLYHFLHISFSCCVQEMCIFVRLFQRINIWYLSLTFKIYMLGIIISYKNIQYHNFLLIISSLGSFFKIFSQTLPYQGRVIN